MSALLEELNLFVNILVKLRPDDLDDLDDLSYLARPFTFFASWAALASSANDRPIMQVSPANV